MTPKLSVALCTMVLICTLPAARAQAEQPTDPPAWRETLVNALPLLGHRNWIAIVDSAYPAQCAEGVETIATGADQLEVVRAVLDALAGTEHVKPTIYVDKELAFVTDDLAPGITDYRDGLAKLLEGRDVNTELHEDIIKKLDEAAKTFKVLILKTDLTMPYTSVFLQLECGYWNADKEQALRERMAGEAGEQ